jgi:hypothetical protein
VITVPSEPRVVRRDGPPLAGVIVEVDGVVVDSLVDEVRLTRDARLAMMDDDKGRARGDSNRRARGCCTRVLNACGRQTNAHTRNRVRWCRVSVGGVITVGLRV